MADQPAGPSDGEAAGGPAALTGTATVIAPPPVPACRICGRQDESLRVVSYPYVISLIVVTFQRSFAGLYCGRHRAVRRLFAFAITAVLGWWGIPAGIILTPIALLKLLWGGEQPRELNVKMLRALAQHKQSQGDWARAIRCLESGLRLQDDPESRKMLQDLYSRHGPLSLAPGQSELLPFIVALFAAVMAGGLVGVLDGVTDFVVSLFYHELIPYVVFVLSQIPTIMMVLVAGLVLSRLLQWALTLSRTTRMVFGMSVAALLGALALYGLPEGKSVVYFLIFALSGGGFASLNEFVNSLGALIVRGGLFTLWASSRFDDPFVLVSRSLILSFAALVYFIGSILTAYRTIRGNQNLARVTGELGIVQPRLWTPGWAVILATMLSLLFLLIGFPQVSLFDYGEGFMHSGHGTTLLGQGKSDQALLEYQEALRLRPGSADAHSYLGLAYLSLEETDQAVSEFEQALRLNPESLVAHLGLAHSYFYRSEYDQAIEQSNALAQSNPQWAFPHALMALIYSYRGQSDLMSAEEQNALGDTEKDVLTHRALGGYYADLRQFSKAEDHMLKAIEQASDPYNGHLALSSIYRMEQKSNLALQACDKALELRKDNNSDVYVERSLIYLGLWDSLDEAQKEVEIALRIKPQDSSAHAISSSIFYYRGQIDAALREAQEAVRLNPYSAWGYDAMAFAYYDQGQPDLALNAALQASKFSPKSDTPHYMLGLLYLDRGEKRAALKEFETFLELYWVRAYALGYKAKVESLLPGLRAEVGGN